MFSGFFEDAQTFLKAKGKSRSSRERSTSEEGEMIEGMELYLSVAMYILNSTLILVEDCERYIIHLFADMTTNSVVVDTDTDSYPSTRAPSLLFPDSNKTSMTSIFSQPWGSPSRKQSWDDYPESFPSSVPPSPTSYKPQRTGESPISKSKPQVPTLRFSCNQTVSVSQPPIHYPIPQDAPSVFNPKPSPTQVMTVQSRSQSFPNASQRSFPIRGSDTFTSTGTLGTTRIVPIIPKAYTVQPLDSDLAAVTSMDFGNNLAPVLVAHSRTHQRLFDDEHRDIAWGTQYEIARGITEKRWKWEDVTLERINQLKGSSAEAAPKVRAIMLSQTLTSSRHTSDYSIWYANLAQSFVLHADGFVGKSLIENKRLSWRTSLVGSV
jgi:RNA-dependent RNA polymerase